MNARLASEAKYKRALPGLSCELFKSRFSQPDEPLRQQERDLVSTLLWSQLLRWNMVGFVHRLRSSLFNAFDV